MTVSSAGGDRKTMTLRPQDKRLYCFQRTAQPNVTTKVTGCKISEILF